MTFLPDRSLRHIHDVDLCNDDHIGELLALLPSLTGDSLLAWLMADGDRLLPALPIMEDSPPSVSIDGARHLVASLADAITRCADDPGLIIVWKRRGNSAPNDHDLAWLRAAPGVCAERGVRMLGVWLIAGHAAPLRLDAPLGGSRA